ncbi:MAG: cysteine hydrolase [Acidimicrobiia bacterium]|nr:cysteine hydrolase [Acidimicrobiia bacterium]
MSREALVIVDPQQRFTLDGAPFEVKDSAGTVARIETFAEAARQNDVPVVWLTRNVRPQVGPGRRTSSTYDLSNFMGKWAEIDHRLTVDDRDIHIVKPRHSGFFGTDLESTLRQLEVDDLLIAGFTINVCCLATAVDAVARDFGALLVSDLAGARDAGAGADRIPASEIHRMTCDLFRYGLGSVTRAPDVLDRWSTQSM